jgi:hypothetical protein
MAAPAITNVIPRFNIPRTPTTEVSGSVYIAGRADSGTTIRLEVDGMPASLMFGSPFVFSDGVWTAFTPSPGSYLSAGLHTLVASAYAFETAPTPLQTSVPVVVNIGTDASDTLQGPVLGTSITGPDYLFGYGGDDRIIAYTVANDPSGFHATGARITVDGGSKVGTDTLVLPLALLDGVTTMVELRHAPYFTIATPDATIEVRQVEKLEFTDATITVQGTVLNDFLFYDSRYRDLAAADVNAEQHYDLSGWREGRDPNAFFSTTGYLASNADVAAARINPLAHYDATGWREGRDPSAAFDTSLYLQFNPDVAAAGLDPLTHYLATGRAEGRKMSPVVDSAHLTDTGFDATYYRLANPDVAVAGADPLQHYLTIGYKEGRNPDAFFDTADYLRNNPDVAVAGVNPLLHYMASGWREGRDPSSHFDTSLYLASNPDVAAAGINPLDHFLRAGIAEGRSAYGDLF